MPCPGRIVFCPVAGLQHRDSQSPGFPHCWPQGHLWAVTSKSHCHDLNSWSPCLPAHLPAQRPSRQSPFIEPPKASVTGGSSQLHHATISRNTSVMCTQRTRATAGAAGRSPLSSSSSSLKFSPISARNCVCLSLCLSCPVWQGSWKEGWVQAAMAVYVRRHRSKTLKGEDSAEPRHREVTGRGVFLSRELFLDALSE